MNAVTKTKASAHASIAAALAAAQTEMGPALKQATNPHFGKKYADLGSVIAAALPAMNNHGIAVIQPTGTDEIGPYVKTVLLHGDSGETLECVVHLIIGKKDMQGYGSAVTYARRYGLMAMAGIAPEDDDGNAATGDGNASVPRRGKPGVDQRGIESACMNLEASRTLDDLREVWEAIPKAVQHSPRVITAKESRKAALMPKAEPKEDLGEVLQDEIPHGG